MRASRAAAALMSAAVVAGCGGTPSAPGTSVVAVAADDTACTVRPSEVPAGVRVFRVTNGGAKVTEFYVYGPGGRVLGEVENVAPGVSRDLRVELSAGAHEAVCKPGMTGDGIHTPVTVTGTASASAARRRAARRRRDGLHPVCARPGRRPADPDDDLGRGGQGG
ncbi:cupredoxin domain-containing protein [Micromonospora sp. CA-244673]|uniref:cupredoxin domain-containing protein n=1 Tax=Micromonospora sp. CA-244673 TaxID=3239958 RepID=UPI003D8EEA34